jgi:AcrR family transcriptional regulator
MANLRVQEYKKRLILESAYDLMADGDFDNITVEDIAKNAGFGKGTLYTLFESKEAILFHLLRTRLETLCSEIEDIIAKETDPLAAIEAIIAKQYYDLYESGNVIMAFIGRVHRGAINTVWFEEIKELINRKTQLEARVIKKGIANNVLLAYDPFNLALILDKIITSLFIPKNFINHNSPEDDLNMLKTVIFNGIIAKN